MGIQDFLDLFRKKKEEFTVERYFLSDFQLAYMLDNIGLARPLGLLDSQYMYTDLETWKKVLPKLIDKKYVPEIWDCEDIAMQAMLNSSRVFGLNSLGVVIGDLNGKSHAFNIFWDGLQFWLWEPQLSMGPFNIGEHNYSLRVVLI
jgi:hypothetical protein